MSLLPIKKYPTDVGLVLRGHRLNPDFWSTYFGVQRDFSARKGEIARIPKGHLRVAPHIWGVWSYATKSSNIRTIDEGVMLLVKALRLPRADFKNVLRSEGCEAILSVFVDNADGTTPPIQGDITATFLKSTGAELSLTVVDPVLILREFGRSC